MPEQALIHERLQDVELGGADGFRRLERELPANTANCANNRRSTAVRSW
jgi:hypothetical protein